MQSTKPRPQGFTLMELFITVFVLVSTFAAFVTLFYALNNYSQRSYRLLAASDEAYRKLQAYEQKSFEDIAIGNALQNYKSEDFTSELTEAIGEDRRATVFVTPLGDTPHLKKIDVKVEYKDGRDGRTVHYAAILRDKGNN